MTPPSASQHQQKQTIPPRQQVDPSPSIESHRILRPRLGAAGLQRRGCRRLEKEKIQKALVGFQNPSTMFPGRCSRPAPLSWRQRSPPTMFPRRCCWPAPLSWLRRSPNRGHRRLLRLTATGAGMRRPQLCQPRRRPAAAVRQMKHVREARQQLGPPQPCQPRMLLQP